MSEARWWPFGTLPNAPGKYLSVNRGDVAAWTLPQKTLVACSDRQFYGPIPEPPRPPRVRRFEGTDYAGRPVAGVDVEGEGKYYFVAFLDEGKARTSSLEKKDVKITNWLDPVC